MDLDGGTKSCCFLVQTPEDDCLFTLCKLIIGHPGGDQHRQERNKVT